MNKVLVTFFPLWLAPNLITLSGLCFTITANYLTFLYSPYFDQELPPWLCYYVAFALWIYQTIDNLDGRQARRTGSSSPLGLLFDHGVDALNVTVSSLPFCAVIKTKTSLSLYLLWLNVYGPFVFATWEEYFTGNLILPEINGPTDGVLLCCLFAIIEGSYPGFWSNSFGTNFPSLFQGSFLSSYPTYSWIVATGQFGLALTALINIWKVSRIRSLLGTPIQTLVPFIILTSLSTIWFIYSPSNIFSSHPRLFFFTFGFTFCHMIFSLMLCHLTNSDYSSIRIILLPLITAVLSILIPYINTPHISFKPFFLSELEWLYVCLLWGFCAWAHLVYMVIREITAILKINCFTIPHIKKEA